MNVLPFVTPCGAESAPAAKSREVAESLTMAQWVAVPVTSTAPSVIAEIITSRPPPPLSDGTAIVGEVFSPSEKVVDAPV
ncbi:hypothetical protein KAR91_23055 [Candidatus Pacearchaeota archaeon]|nr:hypothetical protein [Candidatus Pacearchaeota archaeon]